MKWALVTGASSGIGYEFAKVLAKDSYNVILVARRKEKLEQLKEQLQRDFKIKAEVITADLSKPEEVDRVHSSSKSFTPQLDVLINNAGFGALGLFHEMDDGHQLNMIDLNVRSLTHMTHLFAKDMVAAKAGYICNVASTAAFQPGPLMAVYFATKAYVLSFSEALQNELKDFGVTVSALCPGATESEFKVRAHMEESGLMNTMKLPSSMDVAQYGYKSLKAGKSVAIHGCLNAFLAFMNRFSPRALAIRITRKLIEKA